MSTPHQNSANSANSAGDEPLTPEQRSRSKKETALRTSIAEIETKVNEIERQIAETKAKLRNDPADTVQRHIRLLHEYNEIKDIGQGLMGLLADARGVRQIDVQREFGVGDRD